MLVKPGQAAVERGVLEERLLSSVAAGLVYEVSCSCNQIETMGRTGVGRWRRLPRGWHLSRSRLGWKAVQNQFGAKRAPRTRTRLTAGRQPRTIASGSRVRERSSRLIAIWIATRSRSQSERTSRPPTSKGRIGGRRCSGSSARPKLD
jgi:hypothetical protein